MIEGKHIFFTYGNPETDKNPVLNYVDLQIPDGQIVGLLGKMVPESLRFCGLWRDLWCRRITAVRFCWMERLLHR